MTATDLAAGAADDAMAGAAARAGDVVRRDRALPALAILLDEQALRAEIAGAMDAATTIRVERLRYKPGTSIHAALRVGDGRAAMWLLFAGYDCVGAPKHAKDEAAAARREESVIARDSSGRWTVVPAIADRSFRRSAATRARDLAPNETYSYNPRRRLVVGGGDAAGDGRWVAKLYRRGTPQASPHLLDALRRQGAAVPAPLRSPHSSIVLARHVAGDHADPATDGPAVVDALVRLGHAGAELPLRRWGAAVLVAEVGKAVRFAAAVLPELAAPLSSVATAVAAGREEIDGIAPAVVHGDLSADQVVVGDTGAVLVDLDACALGPSGWDAATWFAAQVALGPSRPQPLPGATVHPLLAAAALAVRVPEPFRRARPDWPARTASLVRSALDLIGATKTR